MYRASSGRVGRPSKAAHWRGCVSQYIILPVHLQNAVSSFHSLCPCSPIPPAGAKRRREDGTDELLSDLITADGVPIDAAGVPLSDQGGMDVAVLAAQQLGKKPRRRTPAKQQSPAVVMGYDGSVQLDPAALMMTAEDIAVAQAHNAALADAAANGVGLQHLMVGGDDGTGVHNVSRRTRMTNPVRGWRSTFVSSRAVTPPCSACPAAARAPRRARAAPRALPRDAQRRARAALPEDPVRRRAYGRGRARARLDHRPARVLRALHKHARPAAPPAHPRRRAR